jgi:periplasmic protein TonB
MSSNTPQAAGPQPPLEPVTPKPIETGWLGAQSLFAHQEETKIGRAMSTSIAVHVVFLGLLLYVLSSGVVQLTQPPDEPMQFKTMAFVPEKGPGGGGGGSPAPAPKKAVVEIPKTAAPVVVPVPQPTPVEPPPVPTLVAPIVTNTNNIIQSSGNSVVSLATYGGGGRGGGIGAGTGNGVGPGTGGGFGGGAYAPGNGVTSPSVLKEVKPTYTSEAMRAKIQGDVDLEVIVGENGVVTDVRVTKSLDRVYGLDQAAIAAARQWLFRPGQRNGAPVATRVTLQLSFRLH